MLYRILYSCIQAWRYRRSLARYTSDPALQAAAVTDLSPQQLLARGIKCLVIDFDGVLAAYAKSRPIQEAELWLHACIKAFGDKIFILSNKPTLQRKYYFATNFSTIEFVIAARKKPFPHGIDYILQKTKLMPAELLVIDDRICTGILAAAITNTHGCFITKPYADYVTHPIKEGLFYCLRRFEQWFVTLPCFA